MTVKSEQPPIYLDEAPVQTQAIRALVLQESFSHRTLVGSGSDNPDTRPETINRELRRTRLGDIWEFMIPPHGTSIAWMVSGFAADKLGNLKPRFSPVWAIQHDSPVVFSDRIFSDRGYKSKMAFRRPNWLTLSIRIGTIEPDPKIDLPFTWIRLHTYHGSSFHNLQERHYRYLKNATRISRLRKLLIGVNAVTGAGVLFRDGLPQAGYTIIPNILINATVDLISKPRIDRLNRDAAIDRQTIGRKLSNLHSYFAFYFK